jgi:hypothetical protein
MSANLQREADELRWKIRQLEQQTARATRPLTGLEAQELGDIQARFDHAGATLGERPSAPAIGESPLAYRRRLANDFAKHSPEFKNSRFDSAEAAMLDVIEPKILEHAREGGRGSAKPGMMIAERYDDGSGRKITKWHGDPMAWMQHFMTGAQVGHFLRPEPK